jgi:hypothetical protein
LDPQLGVTGDPGFVLKKRYDRFEYTQRSPQLGNETQIGLRLKMILFL